MDDGYCEPLSPAKTAEASAAAPAAAPVAPPRSYISQRSSYLEESSGDIGASIAVALVPEVVVAHSDVESLIQLSSAVEARLAASEARRDRRRSLRGSVSFADATDSTEAATSDGSFEDLVSAEPPRGADVYSRDSQSSDSACASSISESLLISPLPPTSPTVRFEMDESSETEESPTARHPQPESPPPVDNPAVVATLGGGMVARRASRGRMRTGTGGARPVSIYSTAGLPTFPTVGMLPHKRPPSRIARKQQVYAPTSPWDVPPEALAAAKARDCHVVRAVVAVNPDEGLGMHIYSDEARPGVRLRLVERAGPLGQTGKFLPGDEILAINGVSLDGAEHDRVVEVVLRINDIFDLTVARANRLEPAESIAVAPDSNPDPIGVDETGSPDKARRRSGSLPTQPSDQVAVSVSPPSTPEQQRRRVAGNSDKLRWFFGRDPDRMLRGSLSIPELASCRPTVRFQARAPGTPLPTRKPKAKPRRLTPDMLAELVATFDTEASLVTHRRTPRRDQPLLIGAETGDHRFSYAVTLTSKRHWGSFRSLGSF